MKQRAYRHESDVELLQAFNADAIAESDACGYVHPGDIPHRLFNGNKLYAPDEVMSIWEDRNGVAAWILAEPRHKAFDAQVRPDLRGAAFERDVLRYAEERTLALMRQHRIEGDRIHVDVYRCDTPRAALLAGLGWTLGEEPALVANRAALTAIPEPVLPPGYSIRPVRGLDEAAALAEVDGASFGSVWTPELYRQVMESPGYAAEREFIVEATNGAFAAFVMTWHDPVNRTGLLEPVGTHCDHRRLGLGRAIVQHAMRAMAAAGMAQAIVVTGAGNEAAQNLYRACCFEPWRFLDRYTKPVAPENATTDSAS